MSTPSTHLYEDPAHMTYALDPTLGYADTVAVGSREGVELRASHVFKDDGGWHRIVRDHDLVRHEPVDAPPGLVAVNTRPGLGQPAEQVLVNPNEVEDGRERGKLAVKDPARPDPGPGRTTTIPAADAPDAPLEPLPVPEVVHVGDPVAPPPGMDEVPVEQVPVAVEVVEPAQRGRARRATGTAAAPLTPDE